MVVHPGKSEHNRKTKKQPFNLFDMHACQVTGVRGGVNFDHTQRADGSQDSDQPPIVVTSAGSVFHCKFGSLSEVSAGVVVGSSVLGPTTGVTTAAMRRRAGQGLTRWAM